MKQYKEVEGQRIQNMTDLITAKSLNEDFPLEMRGTLHLIRRHDLVGMLMAQAVKQGEFDNLEGAGKPLNLYENPFEPMELRMVHKILKDHGFAPQWIELHKEINFLQAKLDQEFDSFQKYTKIVFGEKRNSAALRRYQQKKKSFYAQSREHLEVISKKILDYNLHCPVSSLGRSNFNVEAEMNRIVENIEKIGGTIN